MATPASYPQGNVVRVRAHFQQEVVPHTLPTTYADYDPTGIGIVITDPTGATQTYTYPSANVTKESTSRYLATFTLSSAGKWYYRWFCTDGLAESPVLALPTH